MIGLSCSAKCNHFIKSLLVHVPWLAVYLRDSRFDIDFQIVKGLPDTFQFGFPMSLIENFILRMLLLIDMYKAITQKIHEAATEALAYVEHATEGR